MLSEEQISLIQDRKAEQCRAEQESNTTGSRKYCCMTCFHFKTQACDGLSNLEKVCDQWYSPDSQIQGLAYSRDEVVSKIDRRRSVMAATADFLAGRKKPKEPRRFQTPKTESNLFVGMEP